MRLRYLPYLAVPLAILSLVALQAALGVLRGPRESVAFIARGNRSEARLFEAAAESGGRARLAALAAGKRLGGLAQGGFLTIDGKGSAADGSIPVLALCDTAIRAPEPEPPGGGSPFGELEGFKNLAWSGASLVIGYHSLAESQRGAAIADLAEAGGIEVPRWVGVALSGLDDKGRVPESMRRAWEKEKGRAWDIRGDGIVLQSLEDGRVIVLRRGAELGVGGLRIGGDIDSAYSGWFVVSAAVPGSDTKAVFTLDTRGEGDALLSSAGLRKSFPALVSRSYGKGRVWTMLGDFAGPGTRAESIGPLPTPRLQSRLTLDSPDNPIALYWRILVPIVSEMLSPAPLAARGGQASTLPLELRSEGPYLERRAADGSWQPWFVEGVDIGASVPGGTATEPPTDDGYWLRTFEKVSAAGFDSIRIYTLLPPAFYRALTLFNGEAAKPLYLFQGIWLDEDPPGRDLLDPAWMAATMAESDRCEDALHGAATIAPRRGRSWGEYRVDVSPWLAAFLVGRELLPEEVEATQKAHPDYRWEGRHFSVAAGQPIVSFLAAWADRVQTRELTVYKQSRPVGLVSWPTLDPLHHPGEWSAGSSKPPYQDRDVVDFRAVTVGPEEKSGFFTAFHVYPNYPDFMTRDRKYAIRDSSGMARYGAYLSDLLSVLPPVPFIVAEFGLSTGYGTAHLHPEGLDHGGLTEEAQATGIVNMFKSIASRGASGAMVFEWSDEWSKKTWTTEPFMIPYDRHQLWHNAIDPEQNYGLLGWNSTAPLTWTDSGEGIRTAGDPDFFLIELDPPPSKGASQTIEIGLDVVPGKTGQYRLDEEGPKGPQGSEFKLVIKSQAGIVSSARLLVSPDYDRGAGQLWPVASVKAEFTTITTLVNAGIRTQDGIVFPPLYEDGSRLPLDSAGGPGLLTEGNSGKYLIRIPWSRLNVADPSSGTILLDRRDVRPISAEDAIATTKIDSIGVWVVVKGGGGTGPRFMPGEDRDFRAPLATWESVSVAPRPKEVLSSLPHFLLSWNPLEEATLGPKPAFRGLR